MPATGSGSRPPSTILVIERDLDVRKLVATVLGQRGFTVLEGAGAHAMELCRALGERVDVLLSEDPMPANGIPSVILKKPFSLPELVASVEAATNGHGAAKNGSRPAGP